jgi:O-antigen ligase
MFCGVIGGHQDAPIRQGILDGMEPIATPSRNQLQLVVAALLIGVGGLAYVWSLSLGWRAAFVVHAGALFFLGAALCLRRLRSYFLFIMVFCTSLQFQYHFVHVPLKTLESQPFISGIPIDIVDVALIILYAHWILVLSLRHASHRIRLGHPLGTIFVLWILWCLGVSLFHSKQLNYSLFEVLILVKGFLLFFYLVNNIRTLDDFRVIVYALLATTISHALYMIGQYLIGVNYTLHGEIQFDIGSYGGFRSAGFFGSWDAASAMIALIVPVGLAYLLVAPGLTRRLWASAGIFAALVALMCAKVRGAWAAVLISAIVVMAVSYFRWKVLAARILKITVVCIVILLLASPLVVQRFQGGTWWEDRAPLQRTAMQMIKDHWIMGVGLNNYPFHIADYVPPRLRHSWAYTVHNEYLLRMAETGVVGFLLYYSMVAVAMRQFWRARQSTELWIYAFSVGLFAALIGSLPYRMVSFYHYLNLFLQFCVIWAVACVLDGISSIAPGSMPLQNSDMDAVQDPGLSSKSTDGRFQGRSG